MHLPPTEHPRIVILGGGFAGLELAQRMKGLPVQIVLIDRNNFFTFQPLLYQVATAGLELNSVVYPFRRIFRKQSNVFFRLAEVKKVDAKIQTVHTSIGEIRYDHLVLATGSRPVFFGLAPGRLITMKTTADALYMRNTILTEFERALDQDDVEEQKKLVNMVIVGGGPTGVELAGAFAEMKKYILPRDYPQLDLDQMHIYLVEGLDRLLPAMSESSSRHAQRYLEKMGVQVRLNQLITAYDGQSVEIAAEKVYTKNLIWTAGVQADQPEGLVDDLDTKDNRIVVDRLHQVVGYDKIYAIGDVAAMLSDEYPDGHPQLAPVALQQGKHLAQNFRRTLVNHAPPTPFSYTDKGTLATVGRNKAVAELPFGKTRGTLAWYLWMIVHLMTLVGFRNKIVTFVNWMYGYFRYDRALRIIHRPSREKRTSSRPIPAEPTS